MAISMSDNILNILKIVYRDGVQSLLFRNSPVLREIKKSRTEGKELRYAAMYGRGGACGGDYTVVKAQATETARNEEWKTVPGQIFSALTILTNGKYQHFGPHGMIALHGRLSMFAAFTSSMRSWAITSPISSESLTIRKGTFKSG